MPEIDPNDLLESLAHLEGLREAPLTDSRRQTRRFAIRAEAELLPMGRNRLEMTPIPILLRDIGRAGVGFLCTVPLERDSVWRIQFLESGYVIDAMGLTIRHCRAIRPDVYLGGGQFCAQTGLLVRLGISPLAVDQDIDEDYEEFLPPNELW